ncbi:MAG: toll/interleukin-1 receptor domain-containing protein [Pseudomonadales bacterium]|jgi:hypothetical protein|nr:toll/interleukin-1 receptor domain-containing protein [Pseudomonadales bacterium]MDP7359136.1 toll/interleukin-1 receptor domain-containing protein [Pseudomonadales bacterium]MDP7594613.1 toll/interleukin-1 receptor domain-containing protein [Pseudomonadales bacterium]HJN52309.1 toll/interleukin-1 receptor domain-containing protein [Pseudomonadales bacterium]
MERPFPAYKGTEPYIFVSYAHEDAEMVYPEIARLRDQGFNIWYDEGISPGSTWRDEVALALTQCKVAISYRAYRANSRPETPEGATESRSNRGRGLRPGWRDSV